MDLSQHTLVPSKLTDILCSSNYFSLWHALREQQMTMIFILLNLNNQWRYMHWYITYQCQSSYVQRLLCGFWSRASRALFTMSLLWVIIITRSHMASIATIFYKHALYHIWKCGELYSRQTFIFTSLSVLLCNACFAMYYLYIQLYIYIYIDVICIFTCFSINRSR